MVYITEAYHVVCYVMFLLSRLNKNKSGKFEGKLQSTFFREIPVKRHLPGGSPSINIIPRLYHFQSFLTQLQI